MIYSSLSAVLISINSNMTRVHIKVFSKKVLKLGGQPGNNVSAVHIGRNDPCFCGSGKKYKKCCLQ